MRAVCAQVLVMQGSQCLERGAHAVDGSVRPRRVQPRCFLLHAGADNVSNKVQGHLSDGDVADNCGRTHGQTPSVRPSQLQRTSVIAMTAWLRDGCDSWSNMLNSQQFWR